MRSPSAAQDPDTVSALRETPPVLPHSEPLPEPPQSRPSSAPPDAAAQTRTFRSLSVSASPSPAPRSLRAPVAPAPDRHPAPPPALFSLPDRFHRRAGTRPRSPAAPHG